MLTDQTFLFLIASIVLVVLAFFIGRSQHKAQGLGLKQPKSFGGGAKGSNISTEQVLAAMSVLDKAMLSNASFDQLVERVLPLLATLFPCSLVAITQIGVGQSEDVNTVVSNEADPHKRCMLVLDSALKHDISLNPEGLLLDEPEEYASLQPLLDKGAKSVLILPVYIEANLSAVLYFGFSSKGQCSSKLRQLASDFANRFSVVLTSTDFASRLFNKKHYDLTTTLINRHYCNELFSLEISRANRYKLRVGVLSIGVDGLKKIAGMAGYAVSDQILKQVAERLRQQLRDSDLIARFSDETFVVILPEIVNDVRVSNVAEKLIQAISEVYEHDGNQFYLNCRVGVSTYPNDGQAADELLRKAGFAMKNANVSEFVFHTDEINALIANQLTLASQLRKAIEKEELFVLYQPQLDFRKEEIVGVEALVRWQHPTKGLVSPLDFLPIAEETNLILLVGTYVRAVVFKQYAAWERLGIAPERVALNISSKELMQPNFVQDLELQLQSFDLKPSSVEIEITESLLIDMTDQIKGALELLRNLGVVVAIDDFGTGYSSLSYITQLPFDVLKLDRSFVKEIGKHSDKVEVVSLIIDMAHHLKKKVCAEGVETKAQLEFLKNRGCETMQGYLLSKPIAADEYDQFLYSWNADLAIKLDKVNAIES